MTDNTMDKKWYVIHTYSGYENKVKSTLELKVQSLGMEDLIGRILVPMEEAIEDKDGELKVVKRKIFPGYVLVEMIVTDHSWYVVRNTPGVTGFVGSTTKPFPLSDQEVRNILGSEGLEPVRIIDFEVGDLVHVKSGSFEGKEGPVSAIDAEKGTITVMVDMFNQATPVELELNQVELCD